MKMLLRMAGCLVGMLSAVVSLSAHRPGLQPDATYSSSSFSGAPMLYVHLTVRDNGTPLDARFEQAHSYSGSDVAVHLNSEGAMGLISSTRRGTYIFRETGDAGKGGAQ